MSTKPVRLTEFQILRIKGGADRTGLQQSRNRRYFESQPCDAPGLAEHRSGGRVGFDGFNEPDYP
jgi:hypothetical protein